MRVKIKANNQILYVEPVENNPGQMLGDSTSPYMYRVIKGDSVVGCITFSWSQTARAVAENLLFRSPLEEERAYLALIPYLPFDLEKVINLYSHCFRYMFCLGSEGMEADSSGYSIDVRGGFTKMMQRFIFGDEPTDNQVRRQILSALRDHWLDDQYTGLPMPILNLFVPTDTKTLNRNALFLIGENLVEAVTTPTNPPTIETLKINNNGIKHVEDQSEFSVNVPNEFVYMKIMQQINASSTGNNSPVIINSQNVNVAFTEIENEVERKETDNKDELIGILRQLNTTLSKGGEPEKVQGLLAELKSKASWVNEKIISHPVLAQLIAQALAKSAGLM
jgi:hypothetical protein